ncbi:MAG: ImmA/IrrE family metallo-endopeptidase, partial [Candidatus Campbellbacteria bacterium]|nr:ImmA/IrrE family metallo-endopeptidase [Candidatus Campbellbacteria bacterium]
KKIAKLYREKFDFNNFLEEEANTADKVFKFLREKIEGEGVYVFKNNKNDKGGRAGLDDNLYGCIFLDRGLPPLILLNSDYPEVSQISTLLHEFAHYLLGEQEIEISENREKTRIEKWCNRFAYHFMISEEIEKGKNFNKQNLKALSEKHFISKMSLMIRFKDLEIVSERELRDFLNRSYKNQDAPAKDKNNKNDKGGVSGNYHTTKKERTSKKFLGVLSENFYSKKISKSEFSKYLGVKYNKVDKYLL